MQEITWSIKKHWKQNISEQGKAGNKGIRKPGLKWNLIYTSMCAAQNVPSLT